MLTIKENKWDIKYIHILPAPTEGGTEILEKVFITKKFTQCKTSRSLNIDVSQIPQKKSIGKFFPKYGLLFFDQANSSSDSS